MTRLHFLLRAQNEYCIQSPFLFKLHCAVLAPRIEGTTLRRLGLRRRDRCGQLRYKLADHFGTSWEGDRLPLPDGSLLTFFEAPHRTAASERLWNETVKDLNTTLSVDLFYAGLAFTSPKLGKQHFLLH